MMVIRISNKKAITMKLMSDNDMEEKTIMIKLMLILVNNQHHCYCPFTITPKFQP